MRKLRFCLFGFIISMLFSTSAFALEVPSLAGRVNDYAHLLSPEQKQALDLKLASLEKTDTTQVVVLTVPSLDGEPIEDFSIKVAEAWKIGQKNKDNGVIFTISKADRKVRIEVGRGLEGKLTDLVSGRIIRNMIVPEFKKGNFNEGINSGVDGIIKAVKGEYTSAMQQDPNVGKFLVVILVLGGLALLLAGFVSKFSCLTGLCAWRREERDKEPAFTPLPTSKPSHAHKPPHKEDYRMHVKQGNNTGTTIIAAPVATAILEDDDSSRKKSSYNSDSGNSSSDSYSSYVTTIFTPTDSLMPFTSFCPIKQSTKNSKYGNREPILPSKEVQLNLTEEFGRLLTYIAKVATGIRLHSAYTNGDPYMMLPGEAYPVGVLPRQQSLNDVMWLSDSLHNFDYLGRAIEERNADVIIVACDMLIGKYRDQYMTGGTGFKSNPKVTFDLHARHAPLAEAIAIFESIKSKTLAAKATSPGSEE